MPSNTGSPEGDISDSQTTPDCRDLQFLPLVAVAEYWAQELGVDVSHTMRQLCFAAHVWLTAHEAIREAYRNSGDPKFLVVSAPRSDSVMAALTDIAYRGVPVDDRIEQTLSTVDVVRDDFADWRSRNGARLPQFWFAEDAPSPEMTEQSPNAAQEDALDCLPYPPKQPDMWFRIIDAAVQAFVSQHGRCPDETEAWAMLASNSTRLYEITSVVNRSGEPELQVKGAKPLAKPGFIKRWGRYTTDKGRNTPAEKEK